MIYLNGNAIPHSVLALDQNLIEIDSDFEMKAQLIASNLGKVYKYVGETTLNFSNGAIYQIVEDEASTNDITWVLNAHVNVATDFNYDINFTSNNQSFSSLYCELNNLHYANAPDSDIQAYISNWTNEEYQRLTFDSVPSGELLQWLQANGHKIVNTYKFKRYVNLEGVSEMFGDTISIEEPALPNLYVQNSWQGEIVQIEGHVTDRIESAGANNRIDIGGNNSIVNIEGASGVQINVNNGGTVVAENLTPENIAQDVRILGVLGTHHGGGGGSITIPAVSNLSLSSLNILSWTTPDLNYITEQGLTYSISYDVYINGSKRKSISNTSVNVTGELMEGVNTIKVVAIATISNVNSQNEIKINWIAPAEITVLTLSITLPIANYASCSCVFNNKAYIFGGNQNNRAILEFDPSTNTIITLSTTLPQNLVAGNCVMFNNKAYIMGGMIPYSILEFDPNTKIVTTLSTTLPYYTNNSAIVLINDKIYIIGRYDNKVFDSILEFDPNTKIVTTLSTTLAQPTVKAAYSVFNNKAYIFGGGTTNYIIKDMLDVIQEFDPLSNTCTLLSCKLPFDNQYGRAVQVNENTYIFGGANNRGYGNRIVVFNQITQTITTLDITLPQAIMEIDMAMINNKAYIFGGETISYKYQNAILCIINLV